MKLWGVCGVALALVAAACGSSDDDGGNGSGGTGGAAGAGGAGTGGGGSGDCPADPQSAVGQSCSVAGQSCGTCADPCAGCDIITCIGDVWKTTSVPPDPKACADGGQKNWCSIESTILCKSTEFCDFSDACGVTKTGYCVAKPTACDNDCPGVCGCDGKSYCNACEAHKAGVDVDPTASKCSDAGQTDAGSDAAQTDAGSDAAQTDAGSDAGQTDAGSDAGQTDAGSDAGQTDAGSD